MAQPKSPENEVIFAIVTFYLILTVIFLVIHYTAHAAAAVQAAGAPAAP